MSARFPTLTDPSVITMHGNPESVLALMWERGYRTRLEGVPDIGKRTISVRVEASRAEIKRCYADEAERATSFNLLRSPEWWREWRKCSLTPTEPPRDWEAELWRTTRIYFSPALMTAVCMVHGISSKSIRPIPEAPFIMFYAKATRSKWRAAQLDWLRRMMISNPTPL